MDHLEAIPVEDLQRALEDVEGSKPTQRLLAAIAHKHGVTQTELAEWYGVQRRTIHRWLERFAEGPLERAATDADRPGRPRKLDPDEQKKLKSTLQEYPSDIGYDASAWTPALVRRHLRETFDVDYSIPSCRRLMREAGLRYRPVRRTATGSRNSGDESAHTGWQWTPS